MKGPRIPAGSPAPDVFEIPAPDNYRCLAVYDDHGKEFGRVQLRDDAMETEIGEAATWLQERRDKHHPRRVPLQLER